MPPRTSIPFLLSLACVAVLSADDLAPLSDEFESATTLSQWSRLYETEGWGANQMESIDIGVASAGELTVVPRSSSWYRDYRGILMYKEVSGDFVVSSKITPRNRAQNAAPGSTFSLAGIMIRTPRPAVTSPETWTSGGENYIFMALGAANDPGNYQFEVKSTRDSFSRLDVQAAAPSGVVQVARVGEFIFVLLKLEGQAWQVMERYRRADFPDTMQVGITAYTDYASVRPLDALEHNRTVITTGNPDLNAKLDYFRFRRPVLPSRYADGDLTDPFVISDAQLIAYLGDRVNLDPVGLGPQGPRVLEATLSDANEMEVSILTVPGVRYDVERSSDLRSWEPMGSFEAVGTESQFRYPSASGATRLYLRVLEE